MKAWYTLRAQRESGADILFSDSPKQARPVALIIGAAATKPPRLLIGPDESKR